MAEHGRQDEPQLSVSSNLSAHCVSRSLCTRLSHGRPSLYVIQEHFLFEDCFEHRTDPGTFASTSSESDALGGVCYKAQEYVKFPVPVRFSPISYTVKF